MVGIVGNINKRISGTIYIMTDLSVDISAITTAMMIVGGYVREIRGWSVEYVENINDQRAAPKAEWRRERACGKRRRIGWDQRDRFSFYGGE